MFFNKCFLGVVKCLYGLFEKEQLELFFVLSKLCNESIGSNNKSCWRKLV